MSEIKSKKQFSEYYKDRFEFKLMIGDSIICQRYFTIEKFNANSLNSINLKETIDYCTDLIKSDLLSKSRIYTWHMAPMVFQNMKEMNEWLEKNPTKLRISENIFLRDNSDIEYVWNGEKAIPYTNKINDGEFTNELTNSDSVTYKFTFCVDGKEVISSSWDGFYPRYIRRNVDLSNKRGKFEGEDFSKLGFESYLLHNLVNGKQDLIKKIVSEIKDVCSMDNNKNLVTSLKYGKNDYTFNINKYNRMLSMKYAPDKNSVKKAGN